MLKKRRSENVGENQMSIVGEDIEAEEQVGSAPGVAGSTGAASDNDAASPYASGNEMSCIYSYNGIDGGEDDVDLPVDPETDNISDDGENEDSESNPVLLEQNESVFQGCPLSKSSSNLLILKYSVRHNLTLQATSDLLDLLRFHCPVSNAIPSSTHRFYKQFPSLNYQTTLQGRN
jgi:hypothetical protein